MKNTSSPTDPARPPPETGLPPGTIRLAADATPPVIHIFGFGPDELYEGTVEKPADLPALRGRWPVLWVNVNGLGDEGVLEGIAEAFSLHRLELEDIANFNQRPKVEVYDQHLFIVLQLQRWLEPGVELEAEQLSLFLGEDFVLSFQEQVGDPFDPVRGRLRRGRPMIREGGADYLAYSLMDAVIDNYFPMMQAYGDFLEELEDDVIEQPNIETLERVRETRKIIRDIRRAVWPLRDAVSSLQGEHMPFFEETTRPYLRDLHDDTLRIIDLAESYRDQVAGLMDGYMSAVSFKMNEVMGMLTLVGTIFLPLSFLTGLYGMNFDTTSPHNMPELAYPFGYPILITVMLTMAGVMLLFFQRRGWFELTGLGRS